MGRKHKKINTTTEPNNLPQGQKVCSPSKQGLLQSLRRYTGFGPVYCLLMILALFCIRNAMVLSDMWTSYDGAELPEAIMTGNFAYDILDGNWRGWNFYLGYTPFHTGWALIGSCLALPLYFLFGPSLLTLCQVPILFSTAIILIMYRLCCRYFDRTVALLAITLYVFLPLRPQQWGVYPYCDLEAGFYPLLGLMLFCKVREFKSAGPLQKTGTYTALLLFGLAGGIAIFYSETYLIMLGIIFLFWFFSKPRFPTIKNAIFVVIPALLIGLIPYFCFSPLLSGSMIKAWITRHWQTTYSGSTETVGLLGIRGHQAIASLFWPIHNLSFGILAGIPLLLLSGIIIINFQRPFRNRHSESDGTLVLNIIRVFVFVYLAITLTSALEFESYVYICLPFVCILFAVAASDLLHIGKKTVKVILPVVVSIAVVFCCGYNLYDILKNTSPETWPSNLQLQLSRKGTALGTYLVHCPAAGFKTPLTLQVEKAGRIPESLQFQYDQFQKKTIKVVENDRQYTIEDWYLRDITSQPHQVKMLCSNNEWRNVIFLDEPQNLWKYGIDVVFTGLDELAREAKWRSFTNEAKERIFISLAVYYNSNYWMSFLLDAYKNKDMERAIPEPFRKYFYYEFGRRLRSRYGDDKEKIMKILRNTGIEHEREIMAGYDMAVHYFKAPPYSRRIGAHLINK